MEDIEVQKLIQVLKNAFKEEESDQESERETVELILDCDQSPDFCDLFDIDKFPGQWGINDNFSTSEQEYSHTMSFMGDLEHLDEMKEYLENFLKEKGIVKYSLK